MRVKCDCNHEFNSSAQMPTCPECGKRFRSSTHEVVIQKETIAKQKETRPKQVFKEAVAEVPASWITMFAIWGLKFLSMYEGKMKDMAPSGFFHDHTREITTALVNANINEVKKMIDKIDDLKFKLSILNINH